MVLNAIKGEIGFYCSLKDEPLECIEMGNKKNYA